MVEDLKEDGRLRDLLDRRPGAGEWSEAVSRDLWSIAKECVGDLKTRPKLRKVMRQLAELSRGSPPGWDPAGKAGGVGKILA